MLHSGHKRCADDQGVIFPYNIHQSYVRSNSPYTTLPPWTIAPSNNLHNEDTNISRAPPCNPLLVELFSALFLHLFNSPLVLYFLFAKTDLYYHKKYIIQSFSLYHHLHILYITPTTTNPLATSTNDPITFVSKTLPQQSILKFPSFSWTQSHPIQLFYSKTFHNFLHKQQDLQVITMYWTPTSTTTN